MPLNCPQKEANLRLPANPATARRHSLRRRLAGATVIMATVALVAGCSLLSNTSKALGIGDGQTAQASTGSDYCARDFSASSSSDAAALQADGGLVHIFREGHINPPFECASYYLAQGVDIDATSPVNGLTPLLYAVNLNSPQLVKFLIDHGADLNKKGSDKNLTPMGYAYYLALHNRSVDRNQVIGIINNALYAAGL